MLECFFGPSLQNDQAKEVEFYLGLGSKAALLL